MWIGLSGTSCYLESMDQKWFHSWSRLGRLVTRTYMFSKARHCCECYKLRLRMWHKSKPSHKKGYIGWGHWKGECCFFLSIFSALWGINIIASFVSIDVFLWPLLPSCERCFWSKTCFPDAQLPPVSCVSGTWVSQSVNNNLWKNSGAG